MSESDFEASDEGNVAVTWLSGASGHDQLLSAQETKSDQILSGTQLKNWPN